MTSFASLNVSSSAPRHERAPPCQKLVEMALRRQHLLLEGVVHEIEQLEERLLQAMLASDVSTLDQLLDDELVFTMHTGVLLGKKTDLEMHGSGQLRMAELVPAQQRIQVRGDTAIVTVQMRVSGTFSGGSFSQALRYTRVWQRLDDSWRVVAGHASVVSA